MNYFIELETSSLVMAIYLY